MTLADFISKAIPAEDNYCSVCVPTSDHCFDRVWEGNINDIPFKYTRCELNSWGVDDLNYHNSDKDVPCWGIEFVVLPKS